MNKENTLEEMVEAAVCWLGEIDHTYPIPFRFIRQTQLRYRLTNIGNQESVKNSNAIQQAVVKRVKEMELKAFTDFLGMTWIEQKEMIRRIWQDEEAKIEDVTDE